MVLWGGIGAFLFILYWQMIFRLLDGVLEAPRLKRAHWTVASTFNMVIVFYSFTLWRCPFISYFIMIGLMLLELVIFYRDKFASALLCTLACSIHVICIFTWVVSALACITGYPPYEILMEDRWFLLSEIISFGLLDLVIFGAIKLVPLPQVRMINQYKEQKWFIIAWMAVTNVFLVFAASSFHNPEYPGNLAGSQIGISAAAIISLYILLFFLFKTSAILGYKEKNEALEQEILQEQQFRNSMVKDAFASYEVNVTQDFIVNGFEEIRSEMGDMVNCFSHMLTYMSRKLIYSEDIDEFTQNYTRENVLKMFEKGQSEFTAEYRRLMPTGEYAWVRAIINLMEDIKTGDIKAFVCIKNIDAEKKKQLELQQLAERDPLTGVYNKSMAGKLIEEYLFFSKLSKGSAFFMIDVDNFKEINDHFGHVFGDAVLCELGEKLVNIFRSSDIVGRIGGDEFVVFLKDGADAKKAEEKAEEICKAFRITYKGPNDKEYTVSSSIGISFYPKDGCSFIDLYDCADTALYEAKKAGKNAYRIYDGSSFQGYTSKRTDIQTIGNLTQKGFRQNRIEYVFKMLYHSENPVEAIHSALELVASHFSFERGYIFETNEDGRTTSNTFEWCAEGVIPQIDKLQKIPLEAVSTANANFYKSGIFILKSLDDLQPVERAVLEPQGIKSMFQFGIFDKNLLRGFIGFDNCRSETVPSDTEIDEVATICNILATFFVKQYVDEAAAKELLARQEIMDHLDSYIYVIHMETFQVLFMNDKILKLINGEPSRSICYSFFRGKSSQCRDCPVIKLGESHTGRVVDEIYNDQLGIWMEVTASAICWTDGSVACLVNCVDITKQKEASRQHIRQLENLAYIDELTGGRSYYKFKEDARFILEKQQDLLHFLVKLDIDNFKLINQIYGYEKGNEVLRCVAKAIEKTTRSQDEIFARITNDEFIALFTIQDKGEIEVLNKNFLKHFYSLMGNGFSFQCRFPHGRYLIDQDGAKKMDFNDLFEKANIAHKTAKLDKTLDFVFYDDSLTQEALRVKEIENKMAEALVNNEFIVYLQPKYYLENEVMGGAEALVRWRNANAELFLPSSFISIFERNGFIVKLDFYIFKKVCGIIRTWMEEGMEPVVVSVNFSRLHLGNINFVRELCEIVDSFYIPRKYFEIEITETVIYDNIDTLEKMLCEIHQNGFSLSMDDFGSGYSSLGMLKNLPVDVIKMDRSFFANQYDTERSQIVVGSVIRMAAELGIRTVAEGVEDKEHIEFLRKLNCDMVQGYYYAKPMDVETFGKLIGRQEKEYENEIN